MAAIDTILHWFVRLALAAGLVLLVYILFQGSVRNLFSAERIAPLLVFGGAWIVPALALGTWSNAASGRQSLLFYILSVLSIALIAFLGIFILALESIFS